MNTLRSIITGLLIVAFGGWPAFAAVNVKTVNGATIATTKTVLGVAKASVKTIGGVDNTSGGGGPTLVAQDNFDSYANLMILDDATDWVSVSGLLEVRKPAADGAVFPSNGVIGMAYHTATFAANQRTECTIDSVVAGGAFDLIGPAVRIQAGAATGYAAVFSGGDLYLISVNAGTAATINSDAAMSLVAGNKIAIEASGTGAATRLKVQIDTGSGWVDKWTDQNPAVDIDGGKAGIVSWIQPGNNKVDDWKGYDL